MENDFKYSKEDIERGNAHKAIEEFAEAMASEIAENAEVSLSIYKEVVSIGIFFGDTRADFEWDTKPHINLNDYVIKELTSYIENDPNYIHEMKDKLIADFNDLAVRVEQLFKE